MMLHQLPTPLSTESFSREYTVVLGHYICIAKPWVKGGGKSGDGWVFF